MAVVVAVCLLRKRMLSQISVRFSLEHIYQNGSKRESWNLIKFSSSQPQLTKLENPEPWLTASCSKVSNLTAVRTQHTASHLLSTMWDIYSQQCISCTLNNYFKCEKRKQKQKTEEDILISGEKKLKDPIVLQLSIWFASIFNKRKHFLLSQGGIGAEWRSQGGSEKSARIINTGKNSCRRNSIPHSNTSE